MPVNILTSTRNLLAYAVDGLAPRQFAEVSERSHAPVFSLVLVGALGIFWLWVYIFTTYTSVILLIFANVLTYLTAALAAALLPYRRPELFESSPVNYRWAGIPVVAIVDTRGSTASFGPRDVEIGHLDQFDRHPQATAQEVGILPQQLHHAGPDGAETDETDADAGLC